MRKLVLFALVFVGCKNSNYCAGQNPDNNCAEVGDGGNGSADASEALDCVAMGCSDGKVCDTSSHACVQCTTDQANACNNTTPVCSNDVCTACSANSQCSSDACLPSGACAADADVAHVKASGTGDCTTKASACAAMSTAIGLGRPIIRLDGAISQHVSFTASTQLLGNDTGVVSSISNTTGANLLDVSGVAGISTVVQVEHVEFSGTAANPGGISVLVSDLAHLPELDLRECSISSTAGVGVYSNGGKISIQRSSIANNTGGGISIVGTTFAMTNVFVTENGPLGTFGGINLGGATGTIAFSTIVNNTGTNDGNARGVLCGALNATLDSVLLLGNSNFQTTGSGCTFQYSNFWPDAGPTNTGNVHSNVTFKNSGNYHLAPSSPMKDIANPNATLLDDIDGDARPQGLVRDIGADELMP